MPESHQMVINITTNRQDNISQKILIIKNSDTRISNAVSSSAILNITECTNLYTGSIPLLKYLVLG